MCGYTMNSLIDDRGRLCGRLNIVDALVVLLAVALVTAGLTLVSDSLGAPLVAVAGGAAVVVWLVRASPDPDSPETPTPQVTVEATDIHPAVAAAVTPDQTTRDGSLTVVDCEVEPTAVVTQTADGGLRECAHPIRKTVRLTLRMTDAGERNSVDGARLYIGRSLSCAFDRVQLTGTVVAIEP